MPAPVDKKSDLLVVTKAKELCAYIMTVTQKSPKQFRFTFVTRLQNLALGVIEDLYYANEMFIGKGGEKNAEKRLSTQHRALTSLKLIAYIIHGHTYYLRAKMYGETTFSRS